MRRFGDRISIGAIALAVLAVGLLAPFTGLVIASVNSGSESIELWGRQRAFLLAAGASLKQAALAVGLSFLLGWPLGVFLGGARRLLQVLSVFLALIAWMVPPFLWAIGWSFLRSVVSFQHQGWFDRLPGSVLANLTLQLPLVMLASALALRLAGANSWEAARLSGGDWRCLHLALRSSWRFALGAALLGSTVCFGDAGTGQIMGNHGLAGEVFVSLATRLDLREACVKGLLGFALVLPLIVLVLWCWRQPLGHWRRFARDPAAQGQPLPIGQRWTVTPLALLVLVIVAPGMGLLAPLMRARAGPFLAEAFQRLWSNLPVTLTYGGAAGAMASVSGLFVAGLMASRRSRMGWVQPLLLAWITLPSSLYALGWLAFIGQVPMLGSLLRSQWSVGAILGLHLVPLAAFALSGPIQSLPQSWLDRRRLDGMSWFSFGWRVLLPCLGPWVAAVFVGTAVLALADVTSLMLLQPPGATSFTSHLFAVMDNSSEFVVASLCAALAVLAVIGALLLAGAWAWADRHTNDRSPI
jgi:ABC-type Fe3+ transport system permease subunit